MKLKLKNWIWPLTLLTLVATMAGFNQFVNFIEARPGATLNDPILNSLAPRDLTYLIFALIYGGMIAIVATLWKDKQALLLCVQSYIIMIWIRTVMMYVTPLDPPLMMIALRDPFVELFGSSRVLTKDLFFSGHTAALFLFAFASKKTEFRLAFFGAALLVGQCVMLQHVHYSLDVAAAPVFAYVAYSIAKYTSRPLNKR